MLYHQDALFGFSDKRIYTECISYTTSSISITKYLLSLHKVFTFTYTLENRLLNPATLFPSCLPAYDHYSQHIPTLIRAILLYYSITYTTRIIWNNECFSISVGIFLLLAEDDTQWALESHIDVNSWSISWHNIKNVSREWPLAKIMVITDFDWKKNGWKFDVEKGPLI